MVDVVLLFLSLMLPRKRSDFSYPGMSQTDLTYDYGNATLSHTVDLCVTILPNPA